jgi:hypothetical protein
MRACIFLWRRKFALRVISADRVRADRSLDTERPANASYHTYIILVTIVNGHDDC